MIDFNRIEQYRENNRIEAKTALGGLPKSIWETYSAFANTYGGIILLGVEEMPDKSLCTVDLPDPGRLIREFWDIVNDPKKTSVNILSSRDVFIQEVDGDHIVVINVPRAERYYKPVWVEGNLLCAYRRNGEGDYRCTREEYRAMVRDASVKTQDMRILDEMDITVFNKKSIRSYRSRMRLLRPGHIWEKLADEEFLLKLGAAGIGANGKKRPTAAGLLMFGNEHDIVREFESYRLDYKEQFETGKQQTKRIVSSSGDWSGNVYDFYFRVCERLIRDIKVPSKAAGGAAAGSAADSSPVQQAIREALANCLINADYYGRQSLVIIRDRDSVTMVNPGGFRIEIDAAKSGGISDPRNGEMFKMFNLIDIGKHTGSGIPNIFRIWREQGWEMPEIKEEFDPERTLMMLSFKKTRGIRQVIKIGGKRSELNVNMKESIIVYLTDHSKATASEIAEYTGLRPSRARDYLSELISEGTVVAEGGRRNRTYRLKA